MKIDPVSRRGSSSRYPTVRRISSCCLFLGTVLVSITAIVFFIDQQEKELTIKVRELSKLVGDLQNQIDRRKRMYDMRDYRQTGPIPLDTLKNYKDFFVGNDIFFPRPNNLSPWVDGRGSCSPQQVPEVSLKTWTTAGNSFKCSGLPWTTQIVNDLVSLVKQGKDISPPVYPNSAQDFYKSFRQRSIQGKAVLVVGSISPWVESILIAFGAATVTTIDYQPINNQDSRIQTMTIPEYKEAFIKNGPMVDVICSFSSIEHDGLGRYGDPLSPNGDIAAVEEMREWLKPGGLLFMGIPIAKQGGIQGNLHRLYSKDRIQVLAKHWEQLDMVQTKPKFGEPWINVTEKLGTAWMNQPIFVWRKP